MVSMSLDDTTGIFSGLPQLAVTLIGSFVLVLAVLRAFGVIDSILRGASRMAVRSRYALGAHRTGDHDDWPRAC